MRFKFRFVFLFLMLGKTLVGAQTINIADFGAIGDGRFLNTKCIQSAIDHCNNIGGGTVVMPSGTFLSGSLRMKSGVGLVLSYGCVLLGSSVFAAYEKSRHYALLLADGQENISITGKGTIDGQGRQLVAHLITDVREKLLQDTSKAGVIAAVDFWDDGKGRPREKYRPELINFDHCKNVIISGITLKDAACWVQTYNECENLLIDEVQVNSTSYWNNDGLDIVNCRGVKVSNCIINSADDGICLKSGSRDVFIRDCSIRSSASALKFGTASDGIFEHIRVRNLFIYDTYRSAIALECVDGGRISDVDISNVRALNTGNAIFIRLGQRNRNGPPGIIENIRIRNVDAEIPDAKTDRGYETEGPLDSERYNLLPSSITGLPGHPVTNVRINNITLRFGAGPQNPHPIIPLDSLHHVPERVGNYPEFSMFGELPAWGFYVRHAAGLSFKNVKLICESKDLRPAFVVDDANGLLFKKVNIERQKSEVPLLVFKNVKRKKIIQTMGSDDDIGSGIIRMMQD